ncbi:eight-cysteine-cluster domain-containing protein [Bradymonadaceae bacterium TMQ3]|nr:eight-cysteine-cluster domain-containing protein [Bradymonadaceae bacterium TMQ3]TXC69418.1 eight-cysteine-cluster domain-containing protein [Bradymonadales bacterium TMQ1]
MDKGETMRMMWKSWCGSLVMGALVAAVAVGCGSTETEEPAASQGALGGDSLKEVIDLGDRCMCPAVVAPVCGKDGQTYGNSCKASCAGVPVAYEGECEPEGCYCPQVYDPVCGEDGQTYGNSCEAGCADVGVAYEGECEPEGCYCPRIYDPVCGEDGQTYGNSCEAGCADVGVAYEGECEPEGCFCLQIYDPVCGEDGQTYGNSCEAGCADVAVAYEGECRAEKPECRSALDCKVGGCSGQLCGSITDDLITTCEYLPEYACYDQEYTSCGCFDGKCGWEQTEALDSCLASGGGLTL